MSGRSSLKNKYVLAFLLFSSWVAPGKAAHILFYYNSQDGADSTLLKCAAILRDAGDQVTVRDVRGSQHDPTGDNWGPPYDQVWDLRFVNQESTVCGSGDPRSADYFDERWRSKAVSFLNHCGRLFLAGENVQLTNRDEGIYKFLQEIQAVKPGFNPCGFRRGNSITEGPAFYPVTPGLGPVSFFGVLVGGVPVATLNGKSFVESFQDWAEDHVNRSIASGWTGSQLGGAVDSPACAKGKLFMVWDSSMWPLLYKEGVAEDWDIDLLAGRDFTRRFFPAVARWLGSPDCPCQAPPPPMARPTPILVRSPVIPPPLVVLRRPPTPLPAQANSRPETIVFTDPPVNVHMSFADGPGVYRLEVADSRGFSLRTLFDRTIGVEREAWSSWDGLDEWGHPRGIGTYYAVLYKDGNLLRRIVLNWVRP